MATGRLGGSGRESAARIRRGGEVFDGTGAQLTSESGDGGAEQHPVMRAEILRHLLTADEWQVDSKGVRLRGARISGLLDLEAVTERAACASACGLSSWRPFGGSHHPLTEPILRLLSIVCTGIRSVLILGGALHAIAHDASASFRAGVGSHPYSS